MRPLQGKVAVVAEPRREPALVEGDGWEATVSLAMTKQERERFLKRERFLADLHVGIISIPEERAGTTHCTDLVFVPARWRATSRNRQDFAEGTAHPPGRQIQSMCADGDAAIQICERRGAGRRHRAGKS